MFGPLRIRLRRGTSVTDAETPTEHNQLALSSQQASELTSTSLAPIDLKSKFACTGKIVEFSDRQC